MTALPLLLVPVLLTACASAGGSPSASRATTTSRTTAATSASSGAGDLYTTFTTSAQFCALVSPADVSAAMQARPAYAPAKPGGAPVECTYDNGSALHIVSVEWSPAGDGQLDDLLEMSSTTKPVAIDVGGQAGRSLNGDVQVVVGDAAIDVFGTGKADPTRGAALAAAFLRKVR